ncbi:MAG: AraC family transcriptional regulator [Cyanobium sp. 49614_E6]|nr:AraC family transcriptional regulator [Cyanobium sp. 49614_E6]
MPRTSAQSPRQDPLHGPGLATVLHTRDFGCWQAAVAKILGQHRSELLSASNQFQAHFRVGRVGSYSVLHLQGRGRLRLNREQREHSVLWLPLRGITAERINGQSWLAEPGTGLLFQPGDAMEGETSETLAGLSILIPAELHRQPSRPVSPLLAAGPLHQRILASARALAVAAALQFAGAEIAADQLTQVLREWTERQEQPLRRERITARRRRETVESARQWLATRLPERFSLQDLSRALTVSPRQLQYHFQQELGHSPMAEAKRLRLHRLRGLLLDRERDNCSVAELMVASGLIASGVTSADYRRHFGESPRQTRNHRPHELP